MISNQVKLLASVFAATSLLAGSSALAGSKLMSACKKDLKKVDCKAKTDAEAHECLEKAEKHDAKNDGFSHGCYEAHEAYEKASGHEEKGEHHH
jgi:hypothetical protein